MKQISVSVGIIAHNEEKNIGQLLENILKQKTKVVNIDEIIIISSGSTDNTNSIIQNISQKDKRIKIIVEEKRNGKAFAINIFLKESKNNIAIIESGDTVPKECTIEILCKPFKNKTVGMVGAHPIPVDTKSTFLGYTNHLIWEIHHEISLIKPKCGELIAFRKIFDKIPEDTIVDEAWIEYEITKRDLKIVYAPDAIVFNKGSETINDLIKQRRRIATGHLDLYNRTKYKISTISNFMMLDSIRKILVDAKPKQFVWFFSAVLIEGMCQLLGSYDYFFRKEKHIIWNISRSARGKIQLK